MNGNDQIPNKPIPAKWQIMWILGVLLVLWSPISMMAAYDRSQVQTAIDYFRPLSCSSDIQPNTRIAYCISYKLIENDSPLFYDGTTDQDEFTDREINIRRQGQTLFINDQPLQLGESYNAVRRRMSNPWLTIATQIDCHLSDAFYVRCDAKEVPQFNPLGAIILFGGIGLIILGNRGIKIARGEYVIQPPDALKIKARDMALGFFGWVVLDSAYFTLLFGIWHDSVVSTPLILWAPTIIAFWILYARKRFYICAGTALAVIINAGIWMYIVRDYMDPFIVWFAVVGVPVPMIPLLFS